MESRTTFRFEAGDVRFELSGSEDFVRRTLPSFLPFVSRVAGLPASAATGAGTSAGTSARAGAAAAAGTAASSGAAPVVSASAPQEQMDLKSWYELKIPSASRISMQDQILVFAFWMRGFKKYIFTSEDIRRGFETIGQTEPKSLLQILGTLKRDHNLILGTERRGEYMLNTTGIERVREILGIPSPTSQPAAPRGGATGGATGGTAGAGGANPRAMTDAERAARAVLDI